MDEDELVGERGGGTSTAEVAEPGPAAALTAEHYERLGSSLFDSKKYRQAERAYRQAIRMNPDNARYFHNLATALFAQGGKNKAAEKAERQAIRLCPDDAKYHNSLGEYLLAQQDPTEAEKAYRNALSLAPANAAYLNDLGRALFAQEEYKKAEDEQRKAIGIAETPAGGQEVDRKLLSQFHNNLGDALFNQGEQQAAEAEYRIACDLDPKSPRNHNDFGATLFTMGKYAEAEAELRLAVELAPEDALFHNNLADTFFALQEYSLAEQECRRALDLKERDVYHHDLGTALFMQERYPEAEGEYRRAIELNSVDPRYQNSLSLCLIAEDRFADAEEAAYRALELKPDNSEYQDNLLAILARHVQKAIERDDFDEAEQAMRQILLQRPLEARYHDSLGALLFAAHRLQEAESEQRTAITLDPAVAQYYDNLGVTLFTLAKEDDSRLREAIGAFKKAIELDPVNARYKSGLASVLFAQERYSDAETLLREVVRSDEDGDLYHSNLGHALFAQQRMREAEKEYRHALRLSKDKSKHHDSLGTLLLVQRRAAMAEISYRHAVELAETAASTAYYRTHLIRALTAQGKYEDAAAVLATMIEEDPDNPVYHDLLAAVRYQLHEHEAAENEQQAAIRLATSVSQCVSFRINLSRILIHQHRLADAEQELQDLEELSESNAAIWGLLGYVMDRNGRTADAEANYRRSLAIEANVTVHCNLGILLARSGRFSEAAEEIYRTLDDVPDAWMPHYALGLLALEQADEYNDRSYYDESASHFNRAISALDSFASSSAQRDARANLHLNLGYAHGKLGRSSRAVTEFRTARREARKHSRTWFAADANLRRYRRGQQATGSQRTQGPVFITLAVAVLGAAGWLEWRNKITSPYLVTFVTLGMILFVMAFYLPIVTNIKLGPVSLEKQAALLRSDPPEPISSLGNSPDLGIEAWEDDQLAQVVARDQAVITLPAATDPEPTPQETPPLPQPFGARLSDASG
jgi:Flp pilus assembly protein TadD